MINKDSQIYKLYMMQKSVICLYPVIFFFLFLPVILIFVYFCLKVDEESYLLFFVQTSVNCY